MLALKVFKKYNVEVDEQIMVKINDFGISNIDFGLNILKSVIYFTIAFIIIVTLRVVILFI